jgi:hypothetical protein
MKLEINRNKYRMISYGILVVKARDKEMGHCRVKAAMTLFVAPSSG